jgi:hypothetical protein
LLSAQFCACDSLEAVMLHIRDSKALLKHAVQVLRPTYRGGGMQMSGNVIIGFDGGGSKSLCSVITLEEPSLVLAKAKAGPCNGYEDRYCPHYVASRTAVASGTIRNTAFTAPAAFQEQ